jgi:hypothetical protein
VRLQAQMGATTPNRPQSVVRCRAVRALVHNSQDPSVDAQLGRCGSPRLREEEGDKSPRPGGRMASMAR